MYLLIPYHLYHSVLALLGDKPYKEVRHLVESLGSTEIQGEQKVAKVSLSLVNMVVDYMHTSCPHYQVHKLIAEIQNCPASKESPVGNTTTRDPT